jgi:hypothetical protein
MPRCVAHVCALVNGYVSTVSLRNLFPGDIVAKLHELKDSNGAPIRKLKKMQYTRTPSSQGNWHPFLFK